MRKSIIISLAMFIVGFSFNSAHASPCEEKKDQISQILKGGASGLNQRLEEIQASEHLSLKDKTDFKYDADWIVAWLRDQSEIILLEDDCSGITGFLDSVRAQWNPIVLKSHHLYAQVMLWHLDKIPRDVELEHFSGARGYFQRVLESETMDNVRFLLRKGVFSMRQGVRSVRQTAIMDGE